MREFLKKNTHINIWNWTMSELPSSASRQTPPSSPHVPSLLSTSSLPRHRHRHQRRPFLPSTSFPSRPFFQGRRRRSLYESPPRARPSAGMAASGSDGSPPDSPICQFVSSTATFLHSVVARVKLVCIHFFTVHAVMLLSLWSSHLQSLANFATTVYFSSLPFSHWKSSIIECFDSEFRYAHSNYMLQFFACTVSSTWCWNNFFQLGYCVLLMHC